MKIFLKDYNGPVVVKVDWNSITEITSFNQNDTLNNLLLPAGLGVDSSTKAGITVIAGGLLFIAIYHPAKHLMHHELEAQANAAH